MEEKQLLQLLRNSPAEGLREAIRLYGRGVETVCMNILGHANKEDVEECISDVFVKLWNGLEQFDAHAGGTLKSYIYGIARHTAIDRRRTQKEPLLPVEENDLGIEVDFADETARSINAKIVRETVEGLQSPDKEIFIYRFFYYEPMEAIAMRLGLSPKSVESRLYRGKKKLRAMFVERGIIL